MPQLVGSSCVRCCGRIRSVLDAEFCPCCEQPVHEACRSASLEEGTCRICGAPSDPDVFGSIAIAANAADEHREQRGLLWHLFSTRGRAPRSTYFMHTVFDGVVGVALFIAIGVMLDMLGQAAEPLLIMCWLGVFAVMGWSEIAVTVRRLHDLNRPGSHFVLLMIPFYNIYLQIVLLCRCGTIGDNQYGPDPLSSKDQHRSPGEALLQEGTRHELNGDWDLAFDSYKAAAEALRGQPDEEYAINCIRRLQEKLALSESAQQR
jgi:uncharacterized membrane protein YhaH (DUF805 family)